MKRHAAPIIAAVLLLLPVLYVVSYLALVVPAGLLKPFVLGFAPNPPRTVMVRSNQHYRIGGDMAATFFYPVEQIDRKVRPGAWKPPSVLPGPNRITIGDDGLERIGVDFD